MTGSTRAVPEPRNATVTYPGGLRARWRWGGSGQSAAVFALSEAGGTLIDLGPSVSADPDALCRAELRLEGPRGAWAARFASTIHDEPRGLYWDTAGLLVVAWLAWTSRSLTSRLTGVAAGLIAGGALGNLADRMFRGDRFLHGAVIDFIDFQWFPIFNIADMAIDIGGALFVLWTVFGHRRSRRA